MFITGGIAFEKTEKTQPEQLIEKYVETLEILISVFLKFKITTILCTHM